MKCDALAKTKNAFSRKNLGNTQQKIKACAT